METKKQRKKKKKKIRGNDEEEEGTIRYSWAVKRSIESLKT